MELTIKAGGRSQTGGSRLNVHPPGGSKYASTFGRRQAPSAAKSDKSAPAPKQHQILNEFNVDVTPLPMVESTTKRITILAPGVETSLVGDFPSVVGAGSLAGGPFNRSVFNTMNYDTADDFSEPDISNTWKLAEPHVEAEEVLTDKDLDEYVTVYLEETETKLVFELLNTCIKPGSDEEKEVMRRNKRYKFLVASRDGNDRYVSKEMNTFNHQQKVKHVQTNPVNHQDRGINASCWDMYDTYRGIQTEGVQSTKQEENDENFLENSEGLTDAENESGKSLTDETMNSSMTSSFGSQNRSLISSEKSGEDQVKNSEKILQNERFLRDLFMMERFVNLNTYQSKLADYRNLPGSFDAMNKDGSMAPPSLHKLWSFACPMTKGRTVSCMAWNPNNPDVVAVGYGQLEFKSQKPGLTCCWSLKNQEYPEKFYPNEYGITAVSFSNFNNNLLAVGMYNGGLAIYDISTNSNEALLHNLLSPHKHTGPIGQVKWIEKEKSSDVAEKMEILVSISKDGRVTSWSIRKGFECNDLMRLRRVGMSAKVAGKSREKKVEMFISRYDGGMCLDFSPVANNIYLVGTEEAYIHKCSCSYNEQYLDTYVGHLAPVYSVLWSPFLPDVFLSCGADWTVRLWHQDRMTPILTFSSSVILEGKFEANRSQKSIQLSRSGEKTVYRLKNVFSIDWSPRSSTVFACVNEDGIEIWDLSKNILDPIINYPPKDAPKGPTPTHVTFAKNSDCVFVGDDEGNVVVLQLKGVSTPQDPDKQKQLLIQILNSTLANQLNASEEQCNLFKTNSDTSSLGPQGNA